MLAQRNKFLAQLSSRDREIQASAQRVTPVVEASFRPCTKGKEARISVRSRLRFFASMEYDRNNDIRNSDLFHCLVLNCVGE